MERVRGFALTAVLISVIVAAASAEKRPVPTWQTPSLPEIRDITEFKSRRVQFHGKVPRNVSTACDMECQRRHTSVPTTTEDVEEELSFETLDMGDMAVTVTNVQVGDVPADIFTSNFTKPQSDLEIDALSRRKRNIFGPDSRFSLYSRKYRTMYPFSTAVKLSTGCSGILLSPKHVLTSAHCIHDGKRYVKGVRKLKVGKQMSTVQKRGRGRKARKGRKGGKKRRRHGRKNRKSRNLVSETHDRTKRDLSLLHEPLEPYFKWRRAKRTYLPKRWLRGSEEPELPIEYDYAVIELRKPLGSDFMSVGICPSYRDMPSGHKIHFTGFDSDRKDEMLYRFCQIQDESDDLMYHYCDAEEGTSGSGIYIRLYDRENRLWSRRVVGVFSGHQWVNFPNGSQKEFNTGVRITPLKYAQICFWTKGSYEECRGA